MPRKNKTLPCLNTLFTSVTPNDVTSLHQGHTAYGCEGGSQIITTVNMKGGSSVSVCASAPSVAGWLLKECGKAAYNLKVVLNLADCHTTPRRKNIVRTTVLALAPKKFKI